MSDLKFESAGQKQAREQAADLAAVKTAAELAEIRAKLEKQEAENVKAARASKIRELIAIGIAGATFIATVGFGIAAVIFGFLSVRQ